MNVLSIDFDIIMEPTINYYNDWINKGWKSLCSENPGFITAKASFCNYNLILHILEKILNFDTPIYIAYNHKTIVNFLQNDNDLVIYNIDHHHDLGYGNLVSKDETLNNLNCGNWAKYLFDNNQLKKYVWLKNNNSINPSEDLKKDYNYEIESFIDYIHKDFFNINFDKVYICLSPEWVSPYYFDLFMGLIEWIEIKFDKKININKEGYENYEYGNDG